MVRGEGGRRTMLLSGNWRRGCRILTVRSLPQLPVIKGQKGLKFAWDLFFFFTAWRNSWDGIIST